MSVPPQRSRNEMGIYARFGSVSRPHEIRVEDNGYGSVKSLVDWLNNLFPYLNLPSETSEEELRDCLIDGTVLCSIVNKLRPGLIDMRANLRPSVDYLKRFLDAMDEMGLLRFVLEDIQQVCRFTMLEKHYFQGYMLPVLQCLGTLKEHLENVDIHSNSRRRWNVHEVELSNRADLSQRDSSVSVERSAINDEEKQRNSTDGSHRSGLSGSDSSEPSPSLVHDAGNKLFEVLKQGSSTDCSDDNINELIKFSSMDNTSTHALFGFLNKILDESIDKNDGHVYHTQMARMLKQVVQVIEQRVSAQAENMKDQNSLCRVRSGKYQSRVKVFETIASESTEEIEVLFSHLKQLKIEKAEIEEKERLNEQDLVRLKEDKIFLENEKSALKHELETLKKVHEEHCLQLEAQTMQITQALGKKSRDLECSLTESKKRVKQLESFSESKFEGLKKKEETFRVFLGDQQRVLQELRTAYASIKQEVRMTKRKYAEQFYGFGLELEGVVHAAENYHSVLAENRKLYNEVQDLKGNIRVYCRVRPFLPGQCKKQTTIEYMGENGELLVSNPSKPGKDTHRMFKFNKVFGPAASQEEVFLDTRPLIRTVLDGFNVCIFAYGQTGSGKTYTMSGPNISSKEGWGVNYRALRDLFQIAQSRKGSVTYEIGVQMVEIYNEQVRDLLTYHGGQRRLGIWSTTQPNGLAVPDASMHQVISTEDVLELMNIGLMNRAVGATALNERSSRSHRSLSALGDVIFALAQKSQHVPYRNSKLTQVLQSSLGGQAKTLMFVQLNPDLDSYSETLSTLKFALGAARSNREGRDIRELVDQVTSLKQTIAKKDDEIERLQQLKVNVNGPRSVRIESSPRRYSIGNLQQSPKSPGRKTAPLSDKEMDICSENGERTSDAFSLQSMDELKRHKGHLGHSKPMIDLPAEAERAKRGLNSKEEAELFCVGGGDSDERVSDLSDGCLSMGTETDGSSGSGVECTQFPESAARPSEDTRQMEPAGSTQGTISSRIVNSVEATRRHGNSAQIARSTGAGSPAVGSER
ncbi:Kinesin-like protein KIN-14J [Linum perenne]